MSSPTQILADPNFHALPLGERLKVMRTVDLNFAGLPPRDQGTVLYQAAQQVHPTPSGASEEDRPIWRRALENLPDSVSSFVKNAPLAPSAGPHPIQDEHGNWSFPPISLSDELGGLLSHIGGMVSHPEESFANDPVGTVAYPLMALHGGLTDAPGAFVKGAGKAAGNEVGPFLRGVNPLEHPLAVLPDLINAVKRTFQGGMEGVKDYRTLQDIREMAKPKPMSGSPTMGRFDPSQYGPPPARPPAPSGYPSIKPISPSTVDVSAALPDVNPVQGSPVPANVAKFKHGAEHTDLIRQNHATAAELGVSHVDLSKAAKAVYGVDSYSKLSYLQLTALHEYLLKNKTLPSSPRDLLPE